METGYQYSSVSSGFSAAGISPHDDVPLIHPLPPPPPPYM
jgi:hypothetical protein